MSVPESTPPNVMSSRFDRRRFLRGVGACVALPALESIAAKSAVAAVAGPSTTASGAPLRTAFISFPNGAIPAAWKPTGIGPKFAFGSTLQALEPVRDLVQVMGGLDLAEAEGREDGGGDHARGNGVFLTAVRINKSATDVRAGISIDQEIASAIGSTTRFRSLELTGEHRQGVGTCDSGYACTYQYNLSWSSPTTPRTAESNPRLVFERLFGSGKHGERAANFRLRRQQQKSVLDFVLEEARSLGQRAAVADRRKLDEYLSSVRDIERRIERAEQFGNSPDPQVATPAGISDDYGEYLAQMFELMRLAFQTDSTRVATFQLAHDGSNRSFDHIGVSEGHHELSHHQNRQAWIEKVAAIDRWYAEMFAGFLKSLKDTTDSDGNSLLYNSQIVYGSGNSDGNRHTHRDLPIVLAGAAGGAFRSGRYMNYRGTPLANLYLRMAHNAGANDLARFGDSTEALRNI